MNYKAQFTGAVMAVATAMTSTAVLAEPGAWSDEPVRIVVTFPPGGTSDLVARLLAQQLDTGFGQKAVVDNRPGAAGTVAADYVAQQPADGTTLILSNNAPFTISPTRFKSLPYDPIADFTHVAFSQERPFVARYAKAVAGAVQQVVAIARLA